MYFGPMFLMHFNKRIRGCCFSHTLKRPTYICLRVLGKTIISRALSVSLIYNDCLLQFYWPVLSPTLKNRRGLHSRCGKMKDLYNASITSIGTKGLILLSAPVCAYAFLSWLEIRSIKADMLSSSTLKIKTNLTCLSLSLWLEPLGDP